jgi:hypothetical protein
LFEVFFTGAGLFTLAFEITYIFLIWWPSTRWWLLTGAILLHGFIGMFMGLKTFSLMMLVMNMAFLTAAEGRWLMSWFAGRSKPSTKPSVHRPGDSGAKPALAALESGAGSAHVTVKKQS